MLPLGRQAAVLGPDGPAVAHLADLATAGIDHRLDREDHAGLELFQRAGAAVMQHLRLFMEYLADAVAAEFADHAVACLLRMLLDHEADVAEVGAGPDLRNAQPHAFVGDVAEALGENRRLARIKHAAGVAVIAVLDDGDVDIHRVAVLEHLVAGYAVADLLIDRGADRFGVGFITRGGVVERSRVAALHVDHVVVAEGIKFASAYACFDERRDVVENLGGQAAGDAHFFDFFRGFEDDAHRVGECEE